MTSDDSTHDIAPTIPVRDGQDPATKPAADAAVVDGQSKPPARDRVASETAPVQIQPDGR